MLNNSQAFGTITCAFTSTYDAITSPSIVLSISFSGFPLSLSLSSLAHSHLFRLSFISRTRNLNQIVSGFPLPFAIYIYIFCSGCYSLRSIEDWRPFEGFIIIHLGFHEFTIRIATTEWAMQQRVTELLQFAHWFCVDVIETRSCVEIGQKLISCWQAQNLFYCVCHPFCYSMQSSITAFGFNVSAVCCFRHFFYFLSILFFPHSFLQIGLTIVWFCQPAGRVMRIILSFAGIGRV